MAVFLFERLGASLFLHLFDPAFEFALFLGRGSVELSADAFHIGDIDSADGRLDFLLDRNDVKDGGVTD